MKKFDTSIANQYDKDIRLRIPGYDLIQELIGSVLSTEFSETTTPNILVSGCGTGEEIQRLLSLNPTWRLTGVDPSSEMLTLAQEKILHISHDMPVTFVESTLQNLVTKQRFDGALSVLVSHFIPDEGPKLEYLTSLAQHLKPGAPLLLVDLHKQSDESGARFVAHNHFWSQQQGLSGEALRQFPERLNTLFFPVTEERLKNLLYDAGFNWEGRFVQTLGVLGVVARRR